MTAGVYPGGGIRRGTTHPNRRAGGTGPARGGAQGRGCVGRGGRRLVRPPAPPRDCPRDRVPADPASSRNVGSADESVTSGRRDGRRRLRGRHDPLPALLGREPGPGHPVAVLLQGLPSDRGSGRQHEGRPAARPPRRPRCGARRALPRPPRPRGSRPRTSRATAAPTPRDATAPGVGFNVGGSLMGGLALAAMAGGIVGAALGLRRRRSS